jgi:CPA2 family monovalent cation:H+ antiporter-2
MEHLDTLRHLLVVYGTGLVVVLLFQRLRLSPIVGYLVTGMLVGPSGFGWVPNSAEVELLAEVGVMLLLFSLGLEFSLKKLARMSSVVLGTGSLQVGLSIVGTVVLTVPLAIHWPQSLFWGFVVSLSSTAIVLKTLLERAEVDSVQGRVSLGILIFQDLCVVPMMVVLPLLATSGDLLLPLVLALIKAVLVVAGTIVAARYLFPPALYWIVQTKSKELLVIASIFMFLGTAWVVSQFGLSLALGAFLAGLVISDSEYSHQIFADVRPFRDSLNSLFFISVGMLVSPRFVLEHGQLVILFVLTVLLGKMLVVSLTVYFSRYPIRIALLVGMGLAQIGEFSFVLLKEGLRYQLVSDYWYQVLLSTSVGTMILTPLIFNYSSSIAEKASVQRWARRLQWRHGLKDLSEETRRLHDHVLVCGYGTTGRTVARVLRQHGIPYVILELNAETVRREQARGESIYFGDCTNSDVLQHAAVSTARAMILAISDPFSVRTATRLVRGLNPEVFLILRTKYLAEVDDLFDLGANEVVTEEFETSIEILTRILRLYHVPRNVIRDEVKQIREERYEMFRELHIPAKFKQELTPLFTAQTETFAVRDGSYLAGRSIRELQVRTRTGASVVAVQRDGHSVSNPSPDFLIQTRDILVLLGNSGQLESAVDYLETIQTKKEEPPERH